MKYIAKRNRKARLLKEVIEAGGFEKYLEILRRTLKEAEEVGLF